MRYRHVRLVRLDHPGFQRHQAHHRLRYHRQRLAPPGPEPARAELGRVLERGARSLLGERRWLSDRRVLAYEARPAADPSRPARVLPRWRAVWKEVDAVAEGDHDAPALFVEVKSATTAAAAWRHARRQLAHIDEVAATCWSGYRLAAVCMATDPHQAADPEGDDLVRLNSLEQLVEAAWEPGRPACLCLDVHAPWARALERGWVSDPDLLRRAADEGPLVADDRGVVASSGAEADPPALGAALLQALSRGTTG